MAIGFPQSWFLNSEIQLWGLVSVHRLEGMDGHQEH